MSVRFRPAASGDLPAIVALLTDDRLGATREAADLAPYEAAFAAIAADTGDEVIVGERQGDVIAVYQLTIIPGLSRGGATRAQIESVRVAADLRRAGIGAALMADADGRARAAGATLIQLTTDRSRVDAHRFYERLGYAPSHLGFKRPLDS